MIEKWLPFTGQKLMLWMWSPKSLAMWKDILSFQKQIIKPSFYFICIWFIYSFTRFLKYWPAPWMFPRSRLNLRNSYHNWRSIFAKLSSLTSLTLSENMNVQKTLSYTPLLTSQSEVLSKNLVFKPCTYGLYMVSKQSQSWVLCYLLSTSRWKRIGMYDCKQVPSFLLFSSIS